MRTIPDHNVKIFTDNIEDSAVEQIQRLLSLDVFSACKIRIMPDVHAGAGCVIGFTGNLGDKVIPNIVGVDIGCGILVQPLKMRKDIDFHALNTFILNAIPSGRECRSEQYLPLPQKYMNTYTEAKEIIRELYCYRMLKDSKRLYKSIGSLGGGNHFIELDRDGQGNIYLVIHTGSRNLGKQVAELYQKEARKLLSGWDKVMEEQKRIIEEYKSQGRRKELQAVIAKLHSDFKLQVPPVPNDLCYLEGESRSEYLHDMRLCQRWACLNRRLITDLVTDFLTDRQFIHGAADGTFESVHNYISDDNLIRKGAISAQKGEKCIIPMNMRDGSLICTGKGNEDWNCSAPHGAGRVMSRSKAFQELSMEDFENSMKGIYSETISTDTLDESPMVYKPMEEILANIQDTVSVENIIKPIFNFKAAE
ncbi:MAG: RtcB family protein [Bacteroidales bacterium]|nr:RtcB family protein [Bacteroidales bacterium]